MSHVPPVHHPFVFQRKGNVRKITNLVTLLIIGASFLAFYAGGVIRGDRDVNVQTLSSRLDLAPRSVAPTLGGIQLPKEWESVSISGVVDFLDGATSASVMLPTDSWLLIVIPEPSKVQEYRWNVTPEKGMRFWYRDGLMKTVGAGENWSREGSHRAIFLIQGLAEGQGLDICIERNVSQGG